MSNKENTKRRQFSLEEKLRVLKAIDSGKKKGDIAKDFGISGSTLSTFLKDRAKIEASSQKPSLGPQRKRMRAALHEDVDEAVFKWFNDMRARNIPLSGPLVRQKALNFACQLGHDNFQASVGWLNRFRERFGISSKVISGEANAVSDEAVNAWRSVEIKKIASEYNVNDVFNADETGMFYPLLPDRTLSVKGERCAGGKKSKLRVTALFCCNASGTEKLKPLIIGKSAKPRCFKNVRSLPCDYSYSKKAWMTTNLFNDWLKKLDAKMEKEKRKILLLVDNCSSHNSPPRLQHVRVEFLPPNTTALLQPLDQGIIRSVKAHYRNRLMQRIILELDRNNEWKNVDLKQAIDMIVGAWWSVKESTVAKCWKKTRILEQATEDDYNEEDEVTVDKDLWDSVVKATNVPDSINFDDYVNADNELMTSPELTDDEILKSVKPAEDVESEEDDSELLEEQEDIVFTLPEAIQSVEKLWQFLCTKSDVPVNVFENLKYVDDFITTSAVKKCTTQRKITSFFK